jgi:hypothetical protein
VIGAAAFEGAVVGVGVVLVAVVVAAAAAAAAAAAPTCVGAYASDADEPYVGADADAAGLVTGAGFGAAGPSGAAGPLGAGVAVPCAVVQSSFGAGAVGPFDCVPSYADVAAAPDVAAVLSAGGGAAHLCADVQGHVRDAQRLGLVA